MRLLLKKIRDRMEERGIKQNALASHLKTQDNRITKWLKDGVGVPDAYQAKAIADYLELPLDYLVDDSMTAPPAIARTRLLTEAESRVLDLAREVSDDDPEPELLKTARRLLTGRPAPIAPDQPARGDEHEGRKGSRRQG